MSKETIDDGFTSLRKGIKAEIVEFSPVEDPFTRQAVLQVSDQSDDGYVELYDAEYRTYTRLNVRALDAAIGREVVEINPDRTARLPVSAVLPHLERTFREIDEALHGSGRFSSDHPNFEEQKKEASGPSLPLAGPETGHELTLVADERMVLCRMTRSSAQTIVDALDYLRYVKEHIEGVRAHEIRQSVDVIALKMLGDQITDAMYPRKA